MQGDIKDDLRKHLGLKLPDYMVPSFIKMDEFSLNISGKIDRTALPELELTGDKKSYKAPGNETEKRICNVWQDLFNIKKIGITDDFFHIGGNSILAIQLSNEMSKEFGVKINASLILKYRTIEEISNNGKLDGIISNQSECIDEGTI